MTIGEKFCLSFLGSGPDKERSPVEWGDFASVRSSIHPPLGHPARPEAQPARPETQLARSEAQPASQPSLRLQAWLAGPQIWLAGPEGGMDRQTNGRTENLPILQDFVPYRGSCPKTLFLVGGGAPVTFYEREGQVTSKLRLNLLRYSNEAKTLRQQLSFPQSPEFSDLR